jgi:nicotinamidase-related amidase
MDLYTQPEFHRAALITIDTQRDTLEGQPLEIPGTSAILPNMRSLLAAFRGLRKPIVDLVRLYKRDGSNFDLSRRADVEAGRVILAPNTPGCQLAPGLLPDDQITLDCERLFAGDPLQALLGRILSDSSQDHLRKTGVTTTIFTGCNFPNCPRASIVEASERDFRVAVVRDAVSGLYERGEIEMERIGVAIFSTEELLAGLCRAAQ